MNAESLQFKEISESDIPELTIIMARAFDDDARKHLGVERGGPDGYDTGEFFRKWLFGYKESKGYTMLLDNQLVGGLIVWIYKHRENVLGTIFVDPLYQDRGIGTRTWQFIEVTYPATRQWTLGTPIWSLKNHHCYEECGFYRFETTEDSILYLKDMLKNEL